MEDLQSSVGTPRINPAGVYQRGKTRKVSRSLLTVHGATAWHHFLPILTADDGCVSVHSKVPQLHCGYGRPAGLILHTCTPPPRLVERVLTTV